MTQMNADNGGIVSLSAFICEICGFKTAAVLCGFVSLWLNHLPVAEQDNAKVTRPPAPLREFRAAWVATVANIDWPSRRGLPVAEQKRQIIAILDRAQQLNLNAIILQVRPACDAIYPSKVEPWSEYLTGTMGQPPEPNYDPLEMWIHEAHRRGIELHAWFNPYRAHHPSGTSPISDSHISKRHPEITHKYGPYLWLDPGEKETRDHTARVILDVVKRYDIDGVHLDDYFYPYKEKDSAGNTISFPDDKSWQKYEAAGGSLDRDDWRRSNVDKLIHHLYQEIHASKPWVKFGISPFGIWRPGNPPQIQGLDAYAQLYADSRKWLQEGWVDYWTPQLYWPIAQMPQSYPVLLKWWVEQNAKGRNIWPGNYTGRVAEGAKPWPAEEIVNQILATRHQPGATGNVHFSMAVLMSNAGGISDSLRRTVYSDQALVPASPWLDHAPPAMPRLAVRSGKEPGSITMILESEGHQKPWLWVVQMHGANGWTTHILPAFSTHYDLPPIAGLDQIALSAVDRCGVLSSPAIKKLE